MEELALLGGLDAVVEGHEEDADGVDDDVGDLDDVGVLADAVDDEHGAGGEDERDLETELDDGPVGGGLGAEQTHDLAAGEELLGALLEGLGHERAGGVLNSEGCLRLC